MDERTCAAVVAGAGTLNAGTIRLSTLVRCEKVDAVYGEEQRAGDRSSKILSKTFRTGGETARLAEGNYAFTAVSRWRKVRKCPSVEQGWSDSTISSGIL
jgi:hypothetical protein